MNRHDGDAQSAFEPVEVNANAAIFSDVEHVDRQYGRQLQLEHLTEEVEVAFEVTSIGDAHDGVDRSHLFPPARQQIDDHHFVASAGGKAIEAGEIDDFDPSAGQLNLARLLLDGYTRIVADVLPDAHQAAEEGRFPRVGIADQGDGAGARL